MLNLKWFLLNSVVIDCHILPFIAKDWSCSLIFLSEWLDLRINHVKARSRSLTSNRRESRNDCKISPHCLWTCKILQIWRNKLRAKAWWRAMWKDIQRIQTLQLTYSGELISILKHLDNGHLSLLMIRLAFVVTKPFWFNITASWQLSQIGR